MAAICTKSIPEPFVMPRLPMASSAGNSGCLVHKMRSDIPKMGDAPLDK